MRNKILIVHHDFMRTYINSNLGFFAQYFADKGYQIEFLALEGRTEKNVIIENKNITVKTFPGNELKDIKSSGIIEYIFNNRNSIKAIWYYPFPGIFKRITLISFISGIKTIVKMDSIMNKKVRYLLYIFSFCSFLFTAILCETPFLSKQFPSSFKKKLLIYPNSIYLKSLERDNSIYKEEEILNKEKTIIFSGRIIPIKKVNIVIECMNLLVNKYSINDWKLELVGPVKDIEYFNELRELVVKYNLAGYVYFEGYKSGEEYYNFLKKSSILILPSDVEGQSNVILEGMYFGNAIISTFNRSINYHIPNDDYGFLVKSPDLETMSNLLITLIRNNELRVNMQRNAKKRIEDYFVLEKRILSVEEKLKS